MNQALKLLITESLLDLSERQFNRIILRAVRYDEYPRDIQLSHLVFNYVRLVCCKVVHHDGETPSTVYLDKLFEKHDELVLIDSFVI